MRPFLVISSDLDLSRAPFAPHKAPQNDREEAAEIATSPELRRRVKAEAARSSALGIRSVPHFIFGDRIELSGGAVRSGACRKGQRGRS